MIYTVGHKENYLKAMKDQAPARLVKLGRHGDYLGGVAFQTSEDAQSFIESREHWSWAVFSLDTTWENTYPDPEGKIGYRIVEDAEIIGLVESAA